MQMKICRQYSIFNTH